MPNGQWRTVSAWLLLSLTAGCARSYDHSIAVADCDGTKIEVIERYRQAAVSGHSLFSRYVLVVSPRRWWRKHKEIDITPVDTVDLAAMERTLPPAERWRQLAPHEKASRRVFVSPEEFSAGEYASISSCLERHVEEINRGFATPRPPVEYFEGDVFRVRWAGLRSIAYKPVVWTGNACHETNTSGFRFACADAPGFLSVDAHGYVLFCMPSYRDLVCGGAVGRISTDGRHAVVRSPDLRPRCAQGALTEWLDEDRMRFTEDCRLPSGHALTDLFELRESENLE